MATSDVRRICEFVDALNDLPNIGGGVVIEEATLTFCGEFEQHDCGHWSVPDEVMRAYIEWLPDYEGERGTSHGNGDYVITQIDG